MMYTQLNVQRRGAHQRFAALYRLAAIAAVGGAVGACSAPPDKSVPRDDASPWSLTWSDEFNGTAIDSTKWALEAGNGYWNADSSARVGGWGNEELQCYSASSNNVQLQQGALSIVAQRETVRDASSRDSTATCAFTSARLKTRAHDGRALFAQQYGRIVFRARLPEGQGLWPALWMLPLRDTYGTWAASGEIDVVEARGQNPTVVLGTLHYGGQWPENKKSGMDYTLPNGGRIRDWHVYAVEWTPRRIAWSVDDSVYQVLTKWHTGTDSSTRDSATAPFDQPFYLVMNLAVGGNFLGAPDSTTTFPARMDVDWVRVYARR